MITPCSNRQGEGGSIVLLTARMVHAFLRWRYVGHAPARYGCEDRSNANQAAARNEVQRQPKKGGWHAECFIVAINRSYISLFKFHVVLKVKKFSWSVGWNANPNGRAFKVVGLRPCACWECGFESRRKEGCLYPVSVVCCQVEVSATGRSLVQRSLTKCSVWVWPWNLKDADT